MWTALMGRFWGGGQRDVTDCSACREVAAHVDIRVLQSKLGKKPDRAHYRLTDCTPVFGDALKGRVELRQSWK
jgi:hypothetical protein